MIGEGIKIGSVTIYNCDCMELLKQYSASYFDLADVDPPYGFAGRWERRQRGGFTLQREEVDKINEWDKPVADSYFDELKRVSKNQIIWGGNYYLNQLGNCRGPIIWSKGQHGFTLADGEMAWSSFDKPLRICECGKSLRSADKKTVDGRWHPTQKPKYLYTWVLERYAKKGDKILDTHLGSGTHAMACLDMGFELVACELDKEYFEVAVKKLREYMSSHKVLFSNEELAKVKKSQLF